MNRGRVAIVLGALMLLTGVPAASALHLSVGNRDSVVSEAQEIPSDPSVSDETHATGVTPNCYEPNGQINQQQLDEARSNDPFCGQLVYHTDIPGLQHASPPDQHFPGDTPITSFDVVETNVVDVDFFLCQPYCKDQPAGSGDLAFEAVHTAGSAVGLTDSPDDAKDKEGQDRSWGQGVSTHYPASANVLQENTNAWRMNGFWSPEPKRNWIAFPQHEPGLEISSDGEDTPILSQTELTALVEGSNDLHEDTAAVVCGWTPDFNPGGLNFEGTSCETFFEYRSPGEGAANDPNYREDQDGYDDNCQSPTWICGGLAGPAWYSRAFFPTSSAFQVTGTDDGVFQYIRWHWVVAPHPSDCNGNQQPGVSFDADGAQLPYLAHEVDVWTQPYDVQGTDGKHGPNVVDVVNEGISVPGLPGSGVGNVPIAPPSQAAKEDRIEPNAKAVGGLSDTSQSLEDLPGLARSLSSACDILTSNEEPDTVDSWVDVLDGNVKRTAARDYNRTVQQAGVGTSQGAAGVSVSVRGGLGVYGNSDDGQDDDNHPGPDLFRTDGNVGMFTDKNDDGEYDTLGGDPTFLGERSRVGLSPDKYDSQNIKTTGAYPMLWDMHVEEENGKFVVDDVSGCALQGPTQIGQVMKNAGYTAETGLFQALYLREPATFVDTSTGEATAFAGNNIYLLLSQSARAQYDNNFGEGDDAAPEETLVDDEIDNVVSQLRNYVQSELSLPAPSIQQPGEEFGLASDFMGQCREDTGGWTLSFGFTHSCQVDCSGDTIVTGYAFDLQDGEIGGASSPNIPTFEGAQPGAYNFGAGGHAWIDVDPFDNDSTRQDDTDDHPPRG